jgi:hypothetical protein
MPSSRTQGGPLATEAADPRVAGCRAAVAERPSVHVHRHRCVGASARVGDLGGRSGGASWAVSEHREALSGLACCLRDGAEASGGRDHWRASRMDGVDDLGVVDPLEINPAPRGAMRKEMTDESISSVLAGMPALG